MVGLKKKLTRINDKTVCVYRIDSVARGVQTKLDVYARVKITAKKKTKKKKKGSPTDAAGGFAVGWPAPGKRPAAALGDARETVGGRGVREGGLEGGYREGSRGRQGGRTQHTRSAANKNALLRSSSFPFPPGAADARRLMLPRSSTAGRRSSLSRARRVRHGIRSTPGQPVAYPQRRSLIAIINISYVRAFPRYNPRAAPVQYPRKKYQQFSFRLLFFFVHCYYY